MMATSSRGWFCPCRCRTGAARVFAGEVQSRAGGCGAASTSGQAVVANGGVLSQLYHQGVKIDALVRLETERMRAGLQEARWRHARAVVAAVERAAAGRLRLVETELERARCRNAELDERLRQLTADGQAWLGVARSHEAVAEDAHSCCFETSLSGRGLVVVVQVLRRRQRVRATRGVGAKSSPAMAGPLGQGTWGGALPTSTSTSLASTSRATAPTPAASSIRATSEPACSIALSFSNPAASRRPDDRNSGSSFQ